MNKAFKTEKLINKLKNSMNKAIKNGKIEKAMASISFGCDMLYQFNQKYTDDEFENGVIEIAGKFMSEYGQKLADYYSEKNVVLYYDSFGLDNRGVSKINLNALAKNNYKIVYVVPEIAKDRMPETKVLLKGADVVWAYISTQQTYCKWTNELLDIIFNYHPKCMFYYSSPNDVSGAVAFATMEGKVDRFLIDLTDHAFWLGIKSNDYFCGSRQVSASNLLYERGARKSQLIRLGGSVLVDNSVYDHSGLPFDEKKVKYIFSGGRLYKTLGDQENTYYRIIDYILKNHSDIYFLYAGEGDTSEMMKIVDAYPKRAFLIKERKDFYYLIENCILYINTYPMFGGMMMKYCAYAHKIPVTLRHGDDSNWLLYEQDKRKIEYDTYDELVKDVDRLLEDDQYRHEREQLLDGSVISEEQFIEDMRTSIENHTAKYQHSDYRVDTSKFRREFYERYDYKSVRNINIKMMNKSLFSDFPWMIPIGIKNKLERKIKGGMQNKQ